MNRKKKILVIAAHPDDEVLGCGGSLLLHKIRKDEINIIFMSNGVSSRSKENFSEVIKRKKMAHFPDNEMDKISLLTITKKIEKIIFKIKPTLIYTHSFSDLNIDHQKTFEATLTACRPQPKFSVKEIYSFEIPSSTGWHHYKLKKFNPNLYVDITKIIKKKCELLKIYSKEMRKPPHARSIKGLLNLSSYRGNQVGLKNAEAFEIIRILK